MVTSGMEIVDAISLAERSIRDYPVADQIIKSITVIED
jgi:hypothetical protein